MFVISTVAAKREGSKKFDGAATPDLALVDTEYRDVIWIDVKHPSQWELSVYNQLNEAWRTSEGANIYFEKEHTILEKNQLILDSIQVISKKEKNIKEIQRLQKQIDSIKINQ